MASLLDSVPVIEPHPERPVDKLKPAKFEGRFVFDGVDFTYPSERQKQVLFKLSFEVPPAIHAPPHSFYHAALYNYFVWRITNEIYRAVLK